MCKFKPCRKYSYILIITGNTVHCIVKRYTFSYPYLAEVTQIRDYVEEANQSKEYREKMKAVRKHCPKPGFNVMLLGSQLMIGKKSNLTLEQTLKSPTESSKANQ